MNRTCNRLGARTLIALSAILLLLVSGGCKDTGPDALSLRQVTPSSGPAGATTSVTIVGERFLPAVKANFDDESQSTVSTAFRATLDGQPLTEVSWVSSTELKAVVPSDLPVGAHTLSVTDPRGEVAQLANAFTVLGDDGGLADSAPDLPRDAGVDLSADAPPDTAAPDLPPDLAPDIKPPSGVYTLAGTGAAGFAEGEALTVAEFDTPRALAVSANQILVADYNNNRVRVIENGQVSTLAGDGTQGYTDGPAASAQFNLPDAIAVDDTTGDVFVADSANSCIRKIAAGVVSTFAGTNESGFAEGARADARFDTPRALAFADNKLYVADAGNHRIRVIEGDQVTTLAGSTEGFADGAAAAAQFRAPAGLAVDGDKVYVADTGNHRLRLIDAGVVSTIAGTGDKSHDDGPADQATFWNPGGIVVDGAKIYVLDQTNHALRLIEAGTVTTLNGAGFGYLDGPIPTALFHYPRGLCRGASGELYIADQSNHRVRVLYF